MDSVIKPPHSFYFTYKGYKDSEKDTCETMLKIMKISLLVTINHKIIDNHIEELTTSKTVLKKVSF